MSIRKKLLFAFGIIGVFAAIIGVLAIKINSSIGFDVAQISHASINEAKAADGMFESLHDLEIALLRAEQQKNPGVWPTEKVTAAIEGFEKNFSLFRKTAFDAVALAEAEGAEEEIAEAKKDIDLVKEIEGKFGRLKTTILSKTEKTVVPDLPINSTADPYFEILTILENYRGIGEGNLQQEVEAVEKSIYQANSILISSTLAIILVGGLMAWLISLSISRPLGVLTKAAEQIAHGGLGTKVAIQSQDEIGVLAKAFNQMSTDLGTTTVSRNYLDSILKSMANSLIVIGTEHTIQSVNTATLKMLGYSEVELIGQSMDNILQDVELNSAAFLDKAGLEKLPNDVEVFYRTKIGKSLPVTFSASVLRDSTGATIGIVCVAQDISARKEAEMELEQTGKKLLETSRQAGMAEVAASVLHNVGNVLNSVNVSASLIATSIRDSRISNLSDAVTLMQSRADDLPHYLSNDPGGKLLVDFLSDLSTHLIAENENLLKESEALSNKVTHIKEIVGMQQNYARISGIPQKCDIIELVENAVKMNEVSLERHHITLLREYSSVAPIVTEKHKVLQILVNLIRNAKFACEESNELEKQIILRVIEQDHTVLISVIDNGIGITEENLPRIFNHGFTTKTDGHGFGLHSGALAAKELRGKLSVFSGGQGKGAAFTLDLPLEERNS